MTDSIREIPESILDEINDICDAFEGQLIDGGRPRIEDALKRIEPEFRLYLLQWLVPIEMELISKDGSESIGVSVDPYVQRFPELQHAKAVDFLESIIAAEFRLRHLKNISVDIDSVVNRFPTLANSLPPLLRRELYLLKPVNLRFASGTADQQNIALDQVLEFGRQRSGDPPPFARLDKQPGLRRIVIARRDELSVSRIHVTCQLLSLAQVAITNHSAKSEVAVNGTAKILHDTTWVGEVPHCLHIGPKVCYFETN